MKGYRDVIRQKEYMKAIAAAVIGRFGDSVDAIALTWLIYRLTGSAAWTSVMFAMNMLPGVLLQPVAGALVEMWDKKKVLVLTDILRGILVVLAALIYVKGLMTSWILVGFTLLVTSVESFHLPASTALLPRILDKEYYTHGLSLNSTLTHSAVLVGTGAAGLILGIGGIHVAMLIDAVTFFASAVLLCTVRMKDSGSAKNASVQTQDDVTNEARPVLTRVRASVRTVCDNIMSGFRYIKKTPVLINFCLLAFAINAILVPVNALQTPLAVDVYGRGPEVLSVVGASISIASVLGSFLLPKLLSRFSVPAIVVTSGIIGGLCFPGLLLGGVVRTSAVLSLSVAVFFAGLMCFCMVCIGGVLGIQFMQCVAEDYLARSSAVFNAVSTASTPACAFLVGAVATKLSVSSIFLISGMSCVGLFILAAVFKIELEGNTASPAGEIA